MSAGNPLLRFREFSRTIILPVFLRIHTMESEQNLKRKYFFILKAYQYPPSGQDICHDMIPYNYETYSNQKLFPSHGT